MVYNDRSIHGGDAPRTQISWGAIAAGALFCLASQLLFMVLGSAIGLSVFNLEQGEVPGQGSAIGAGIFAAVSLLVSFFIGGFAASRLGALRVRSAALLQGLAVWAVLAVTFTFVLTSQATSVLGGLLTKAGIGVGAASGAATLMEQIGDLNLRLVSDVKLTEGQVITRIETGGPRESASERAKGLAKDAKQAGRKIAKEADKPQVEQQLKETGGEVRKVAAGASWLALGGLLVTAFSAALGGRAGRIKV